MPQFDGWEVIRPLGAGAQGKVDLVRCPARVDTRRQCVERLKGRFAQMMKTPFPLDDGEMLAIAGDVSADVIESGRAEDPSELGALKRFNIREEDLTSGKAIQRFQREVAVLGRLGEPGVLKLLHANTEQRWMITEFHPGGTLAEAGSRYRGRALAALQEFRPLVASVAALHADNVVHRDIKPMNIFVAADGRLVLGDFGIVFFEDENCERPTETLERVGSRDWMAPWANTLERIDDVKPSFDVAPLGNVLWSMVSGLPRLPYWYYDRAQYNVETLFPDDPTMPAINDILKRCVVENERDCLPSAKALLEHVDGSLRLLRRGGQIFEEEGPRYCRVCGKGRYRRKTDLRQLSFAGNPISVRVFLCDTCGHVEVFHPAHPAESS